MSFTGFTPSDFKVFEIPGFKPRMAAIKTRIRLAMQKLRLILESDWNVK